MSNFVPAGAWTAAGDTEVDPAFAGKRQRFTAEDEPSAPPPDAAAAKPSKSSKRAREEAAAPTPPAGVTAHTSSALTTLTLPPGSDVLAALSKWAAKQQFQGAVLGASGELACAVLLPAGGGDAQRVRGPLHTCALSGALGGPGPAALTLVVAGSKLKSLGGGVGEGCVVGGAPLTVFVVGA